jgi:hypothetical protein
VIHEEPQRPRKHNPAIPADLETICLKCLEKDPAKRYPTAQSLTDDLLRYARNEPISARPAGAIERGAKWAKRNKVVAGALAAVALALLVGASVSLYFGLDAQKQAEDARNKKKDAEDATQLARTNEATANRERAAARTAERVAQRNLAEALVGPITATGHNNELTPYEVGTFWRLAKLRQDEVSWMFFEAATETPLASEQFQNRAEYALHAGIGLDLTRRNAVEQLLLAKLQQEPATAQSTALALVASRGEFASPALAAKAADVLVIALKTEKDISVRKVLARDLATVATRLEPNQAAKVCGQAADVLVAALVKESNSDRDLVEGLSSIAVRIEPGQAAEAAGVLVAALKTEKDISVRWNRAKGLSAVAARMEPNQATKTLTEALETEGLDSFSNDDLVQALADAAARMEPSGAAKALIETLPLRMTHAGRRQLLQGLSAATARIELNQAAEAADA